MDGREFLMKLPFFCLAVRILSAFDSIQPSDLLSGTGSTVLNARPREHAMIDSRLKI
jgi:hypothetical protein